MSKHFKLRKDLCVNRWGILLYRIQAVEDIPCQGVNKGDIGGFVQSEDNLSDNAWVAENAKVLGDARVFGNAKVSGNAVVFGYAKIFRNARVFGDAEVLGDTRVFEDAKVYGNVTVIGDVEVLGDARVYGEALISGDAVISSTKDYIVFKNFWSSGRYFTWTRSNNMWSAGCFYGTGEELVAKSYRDSKESGDNYKMFVDFVNEQILKKDK